jgi:hypothetical protein
MLILLIRTNGKTIRKLIANITAPNKSAVKDQLNFKENEMFNAGRT